jgi:hypothetical protein
MTSTPLTRISGSVPGLVVDLFGMETNKQCFYGKGFVKVEKIKVVSWW